MSQLLKSRPLSPSWEHHLPPWDWGCRCQVVGVDEEKYEQIANGEAKYGRVLSDIELRELDRNNRIALDSGQVISVAPERGEDAFHWNPGDLRIPLEDLRKNYDPEVFKAFAEDMRGAKCVMGDGRQTTVWDWLLDPSREAARAEVLGYVRAGKEAAVAVDYDTGVRSKAVVGTRSSVKVASLINEARRGAGRSYSNTGTYLNGFTIADGYTDAGPAL